jgi:cytoskeletal protein CcmA (bactofilin family)
MFALRNRGTVIAKGLKITGSVTAEGLIEVNGQIEGEILHVADHFPRR